MGRAEGGAPEPHLRRAEARHHGASLCGGRSRTGRLTDHLACFTPKSGDGVLLPAGTVHSLGGGIVVVRDPAEQRRHVSPVRLGPRRREDRSAAGSARGAGAFVHRLRRRSRESGDTAAGRDDAGAREAVSLRTVLVVACPHTRSVHRRRRGRAARARLHRWCGARRARWCGLCRRARRRAAPAGGARSVCLPADRRR